MADKVSREQAEKELTAWLDFKKVKMRTREALKSQFDALVDAMVAGEIVMDEKYIITQKLISPVDNLFDSLEFAPRKTVGELQKAMNGVNAFDGDGKINAYISALTGKGISHLMRMYPEDYGTSQAIAVFFM